MNNSGAALWGLCGKPSAGCRSTQIRQRAGLPCLGPRSVQAISI